MATLHNDRPGYGHEPVLVPTLDLEIPPGGKVDIGDDEDVLEGFREHPVLRLDEPFGKVPDPADPNSTVAETEGVAL